MTEDILSDALEAIAINRRMRLGLRKKFRAESHEPKVKLGQYTLLAVLDELGESTMGVLAEAMGLSLGGLTGLIDRVVAIDLVERFRIPEDRRIVKVGLTDKGREVLKGVLDGESRYAVSMLEKVTAEERRAFLKVFALLAGGLEETKADSSDAPQV